MLKKAIFLVIVVAMVLALFACDGPGRQRPTWEQVSSGVLTVVSNWQIDVLSSGHSDDFDVAAAAGAHKWATGKYLKGVGTFSAATGDRRY